MIGVSDPGGPGTPGPSPVPPPVPPSAGGPPAWYSQAPIAPPPPGVPFHSTKKPKGKSRKVLSTIGFLLVVGVIAYLVSLSGVGQKKDPAAEAAKANENPARRAADEGGPTLDDHWHAAYGLFLCTGWVTDLKDAGPDVNGIHSHGDGLIHIHPFNEQTAGVGATLGVFLDQLGMDFADDVLTMPDGGKFGETGCDGKPTKLVLAVWPSADSDKPEVYESGFEELRFLADGEVWALAVVPEGGSLEQPPTVGNLANPGDLEPATTTGG